MGFFLFALTMRRCSRNGSESGSRKWVKVSVSFNKKNTHTIICTLLQNVWRKPQMMNRSPQIGVLFINVERNKNIFLYCAVFALFSFFLLS